MRKLTFLTIALILSLSSLTAFAQKKTFTETVNGVSFKMIYVEGGTFTMGDINDNDNPAHKVSLSNYHIGETEVTQSVWKAVMGYNNSIYKGDNLPVENISWYEAQEFCEKLSNLTGKSYSLPTEAQWEYAAKGGKHSRGYKFSGSNNHLDVAWMGEEEELENTFPVATKKTNELGVYDMSGNVWEWCYDWQDKYSKKTQTNPIGILNGEFKVLRGGSFLLYGTFEAEISGSNTSRNCIRPVYHSGYCGLRIALDSISKPKVIQSYHNISAYSPNYQSFTENVNGFCFDMVYVEGGTFTMGNKKEEDYNSDRYPHEVTLSDYYIAQTEVPQELWTAIMGNNPSYFKDPNHPVENVSWYDAQEFCKKLSQITGKNYCLPTEAQWEYAARGGNRNSNICYSYNYDYAWIIMNGVLNYRIEHWESSTHPIAKLKANELGIFDMIGNVEEWCQDWYSTDISYSQKNPTGPSTGTDKVTKGDFHGSSASWFDEDILSRRNNWDNNPSSTRDYRGFRIALNTNQKLHHTKSSMSERDGYEWVSLKGESNLCGAQVGGKVVVPAEYSEVKYMPYYNGYFLVGKGGYMGVYDCMGNYLIPIDRCYSSILKTCSDGRYYYRVCKNGKYGACNLKGTEIVEPIYRDLILYNGVFIYRNDADWLPLSIGLDNNNEVIENPQLAQTSQINYDIALEQAKLEEAFGKDVKVEQVVTEDGRRAFKIVFENQILFEFGKSALNAQAIKYIEQVAEALKKLPSTNVIIKGYTDNVGTLEANQRVSNRRAKVVSDRLTLLGISASRLTSQGVPLADYVASNETEEGRALNRRVEIVIEPME